MNETRTILDAFDSITQRRECCALATVVSVSGSAYRRPGARMLISPTGQTFGGISGGCLDRDVVRRAHEVIQTNRPILRSYDSTDDGDFAPAMGCAGVIQILIQPLSAERPGPLRELQRVQSIRTRCTCATVIASTIPSIPIAHQIDSALAARLPGFLDDLDFALRSDLCLEITYAMDDGQLAVFIEVMRPPQPLVIFGEGNDIAPLVQFARQLGWHITIVPAASSASRFTGADVVLPATTESPDGNVAIDSTTAAVVMTHNYPRDRQLLEKLIKSPARYIGILGPKRRTEKLLSELNTHGSLSVGFNRIHSPIGLDIGAETPSEIALAILAEIQSVLKDRPGAPLRERNAPIHSAGFTPAPQKPFPTNSCPASQL